jgi:5-methylcytosine-specific restriction enzyme subunit McrC
VRISSQECKRIQFNPLFTDFETVRDYCVLFLENSVSFNYKNDLKLFAFLLPMEYVFEDFIFGFIEKEIVEVHAKNQLTNKYLDINKSFGLKPDLYLKVGDKQYIADTKYKMVYDDSLDSKKGISQNDLYQMVAYAIRFNVNEIKLFYPSAVNKSTASELKKIEIIDELANSEKITIMAHQLTILDAKLVIDNSIPLSEFFKGLKINLIRELKEILIPSGAK